MDDSKVWPEYLCDYLRKGFGHDQLYRLYTGSTGMVEVAPDEVDVVVVPPLPSVKDQKKLSQQLRRSERESSEISERAALMLRQGEQAFRAATIPIPGQP